MYGSPPRRTLNDGDPTSRKASDATMGHLNGLKLELARAMSRRDSQGPRVGPPGPGDWDTRSFVGLGVVAHGS